jgi:hypothetical protein
VNTITLTCVSIQLASDPQASDKRYSVTFTSQTTTLMRNNLTASEQALYTVGTQYEIALTEKK